MNEFLVQSPTLFRREVKIVRVFDNERISRGVRQTIPNIVQYEVWQHWESLTKPNEDSVMAVSLSPNMFNRRSQKICIKPAKKVKTFPTTQTVTAELIITYFDGEATMHLREEAEKIFGHLLEESLADEENKQKWRANR